MAGARPSDGSSNMTRSGAAHQATPDGEHLLLAAGERSCTLWSRPLGQHGEIVPSTRSRFLFRPRARAHGNITLRCQEILGDGTATETLAVPPPPARCQGCRPRQLSQPVISRSRSLIRPRAGRSMPAMVRISDVLPAPFAPTTATIVSLGDVEGNALERLRVAIKQVELLDSAAFSQLPQRRDRTAPRRGPAPRSRACLRNRGPMVQHQDLCSERHHGAHHVLDQQNGQPGSAIEINEDGDHAIGFHRPQPCHDLIEQQQLRLGRERARHFQSLAVGQRQRRGDLTALVERSSCRSTSCA